MLLDTERLLHTVEQVLKAGEAAQKKSPSQRLPVEFNSLVRECMELARTRHHLQAATISSTASHRSVSARTADRSAGHSAIRRSCAPRFRICWTTR